MVAPPCVIKKHPAGCKAQMRIYNLHFLICGNFSQHLPDNRSITCSGGRIIPERLRGKICNYFTTKPAAYEKSILEELGLLAPKLWGLLHLSE